MRMEDWIPDEKDHKVAIAVVTVIVTVIAYVSLCLILAGLLD